jgi:hypothetical protein
VDGSRSSRFDGTSLSAGDPTHRAALIERAKRVRNARRARREAAVPAGGCVGRLCLRQRIDQEDSFFNFRFDLLIKNPCLFVL